MIRPDTSVLVASVFAMRIIRLVSVIEKNWHVFTIFYFSTNSMRYLNEFKDNCYNALLVASLATILGWLFTSVGRFEPWTLNIQLDFKTAFLHASSWLPPRSGIIFVEGKILQPRKVLLFTGSLAICNPLVLDSLENTRSLTRFSGMSERKIWGMSTFRERTTLRWHQASEYRNALFHS